jgi:transcriptional regulator with PAS, ATPase and Fis domain
MKLLRNDSVKILFKSLQIALVPPSCSTVLFDHVFCSGLCGNVDNLRKNVDGMLERQQGFMPNVFLTGIIQITKRSSVLSHEQEIGGAPRTVRTVENEEATRILDAFEEGAESIREVAQEFNISKTSVHRVMKTE